MEGRELAVNVFAPIIGVSTTRAKLDDDNLLFIDWGRDRLEKVKREEGLKLEIFGEWRFLVGLSAWRLEQGDQLIVGAGDEEDFVRSRLKILENKKFEGITIANEAFDAELVFEDGFRLFLFSYTAERGIQWGLYTPDRKLFLAHSGATWSYEDAERCI